MEPKYKHKKLPRDLDDTADLVEAPKGVEEEVVAVGVPPMSIEYKEPEPNYTSYIVKQIDEQVRLQVMTSTLEGVKYMIVPKMYFNFDAAVRMDDCVLVPIKKQ